MSHTRLLPGTYNRQLLSDETALWLEDTNTRAYNADESTTKNAATVPERPRHVRFQSPLLEYGYRPAVEEYENGLLVEKPLLLYLPGFDSTILSPFLQFPELGTVFDVRFMTIGGQDRSTFDEIREAVLDYLDTESGKASNQESADCARLQQRHKDENGTSSEEVDTKKPSSEARRKRNSPRRYPSKNEDSDRHRPVYLIGESFGGILALEVAISLLRTQEKRDVSSGNNPPINLQGLTLINAATCYDRSRLAIEGPRVAELPPWFYPVGLLKLLPLFTDEHSVDQLLLILQAKALPSVINSATREAFLGRVAFSLPFVIPFLSQGTFRWRLSEWLDKGCAYMASRLHELKECRPDFRTLVIAGEEDHVLPSVDEAERLASILPNPKVHVVEGGGHASTCGSRVDMTALLRDRFAELRRPHQSSLRNNKHAVSSGRTQMSTIAANGKEKYFGMEPRYDGKSIGLNPLLYWSREYFKKYKPRSQ